MKSELARLYKTTPGCIQRGEFTLASGRKSKFYIDAKKITLSSAGLRAITSEVLEIIKNIQTGWLIPRIHAIGGMVIGPDPIVGSCVHNSEMDGFLIRKESKGHGTKRRVEGNVEKDDLVVVIEDTTTTGGTLLEAIEVVTKEVGCRVIAAITVVDRQQGAAELFKERGIPFFPILNTKDLEIEDGQN